VPQHCPELEQAAPRPRHEPSEHILAEQSSVPQHCALELQKDPAPTHPPLPMQTPF